MTMIQEQYQISKTTIWNAARLLVDKHGACAAEIAQTVLEESLLDENEMRAWKSVKLAIREIIHLRQGGEMRIVH
jgi:hypothetical protein